MLAVSLRRRGAVWLQQLAPAARGLLLGSIPSSGRALTASAASHSVRAAAAEASTAGIAAEVATPAKRGRPLGSTQAVKAAAATSSSGSGKQATTRKARTKSGEASQRSGSDAASTVLLVESPAKAKKIQEFLGRDYKVCHLAPVGGYVAV